MAERAHPDLGGFSSPWVFRLRRGYIPWISYVQRPYRKELLKRYKWANRFCKGKKVLDVPCGMGWGTSLLSNAMKRVGVDLSEDAVQEAKTRYGKKISFITGSMGNLPFKDGDFDVLVCLEGIEHVPQKIGTDFIYEACRVLKPHGLLLLSSPYCADGSHSGNPFHIHEYQPHEIVSLIEKCFDIEDWHEGTVDKMTIRYLRATRKQNPSMR